MIATNEDTHTQKINYRHASDSEKKIRREDKEQRWAQCMFVHCRWRSSLRGIKSYAIWIHSNIIKFPCLHRWKIKMWLLFCSVKSETSIIIIRVELFELKKLFLLRCWASIAVNRNPKAMPCHFELFTFHVARIDSTVWSVHEMKQQRHSATR